MELWIVQNPSGRDQWGKLVIDELYRLDPNGSAHAIFPQVSTPNGIGWSPDNTVMYFTDSVPRIIYAFDFHAATGDITNRRNLIEVPEDVGTPDGLVVDSAGYIWSACYAPDGKVDRIVAVPALRPTSCVFGGPDIDELYITSSRADLSADMLARYPLSGDLFRLKAGVTGPEKFKFAG
jgi:sugar lactone lactonase YvrE